MVKVILLFELSFVDPLKHLNLLLNRFLVIVIAFLHTSVDNLPNCAVICLGGGPDETA